jgi:type I restriction enzyme S subunit
MEGWKKMALGDIAIKFFSGGTPSTKDSSLWDGDIQWITSKWLDGRLYLNNGEKKITEKGLENSATKLVKARSLILATRVGVGKVSINEIDLAINQDLLGIEIDEKFYSLEFLAYQLRSENPQNYINSFKRGATIQGVTKDCIKSIELNIPPLPEQRKIAHVLTTVQKAIEQQDNLIRTTTELKKALMQKLFTEGTRGEKQKETEIGLVPESWAVVRIGDIFKFSSGKTRPKNTAKKRTEELNIPVYGGNGILGYSNKIFLNRITLILGRVGEYCGCAHITEEES